MFKIQRGCLKIYKIFLFGFLFTALNLISAEYSHANTANLSDIELLWSDKKFDSKSQGIDLLVKDYPDHTAYLLRLLLDGKLYYHKKNKFIVISDNKPKVGDVLSLISSDATRSVVTKREYKKVTLNNKLRKKIRNELAIVELQSKDQSIRLDAVRSLIDTPSGRAKQVIAEVIEKEVNDDIKALMQLALAISQAQAPDMESQLAAIDIMKHSLEPTVKVALVQLQKSQYAEVVDAANKVLKNIDDKIAWYGHLETFYFGLSLGSVLVLAAIGLAITFGVMGVINMAHGELIMIGAYTTYVVQLCMPNHIELSLFAAIPAAFLVSGAVGIVIERCVIRHLYGRPLETLLATFGVSLILQQAVRTIFSPLNRSVSSPEWMSGTIEFNPIFAITQGRLYIILFCFFVFFCLLAVMKKTALGLQVRAVSQNRSMARAMGVNSTWVDALTFGLGAGIAGIAGVALSQLTNVGPNLGQGYIIDSFMVVVFGGVGNLWGTLVAGLSLGVANKLMEPWAGAVLAKILVLIFIILFIQKRPRGLFPQKGRAAEG